MKQKSFKIITLCIIIFFVTKQTQTKNKRKRKTKRKKSSKILSNLIKKKKPSKPYPLTSITKSEVNDLVSTFNNYSPRQLKRVKKYNFDKSPSSKLTRREKKLILEGIKNQGKKVLKPQNKEKTTCVRIYEYFEMLLIQFGRINPNCVDKIDFIEDSLVYYDDILFKKYDFEIEHCFQMRLENQICSY